MSYLLTSQQVSWWSVHLYVEPVLQRISEWPMLGTPTWCDLPDDSRPKLAAIFDAAQHWALRLESCQHSLSRAAEDISAANDWHAVRKRLQR